MTTVSPGPRPAIVSGIVAAAISVAAAAVVLTTVVLVLPPDEDASDAVAATDRLSEGQRAAVEETVRAYLLANPELLIEMSNELEQRQADAQDQAMQSALADNADALYRSESAYVAGNPDGDVTVVEFFDYNCGYCRRAWPDVARLIESDPDVRVVFKELPILRRESEGAARAALAARNQGKYMELHGALLELNGLASEDSAVEAAEGLGLDTEQLKQDMQSPEVQQALTDARQLAQRIGVQGTPLYLIGDRVMAGAPEDLYDQLADRVEEVRRNGCAEPIAC